MLTTGAADSTKNAPVSVDTNFQLKTSPRDKLEIRSNQSRLLKNIDLVPVEEADDSLMDQIENEVNMSEGIDWNGKFI